MRRSVFCRGDGMKLLAIGIFLFWLLCGFATAAEDDSDEPRDAAGSWLGHLEERGLEVHGALELEILDETGFADPGMPRSTESESDLTFDLEVIYAPSDGFTAELAVSWDDEDGDDFERVLATFGNPERFPVYFSIGRTILPFGLFESNMISDPLTLDIAETTTEAALLGVEWKSFQVQGYVYDGNPTRDRRGHGLNVFGGTVRTTWEGEEAALHAGVGWLENIGDSDDLEQFYHEEGLFLKDRVSALTLYCQLALDPFLIGFEYVSSLEHPKLFERDEDEGEILTREEKLKTWGCEVSYAAELPNGMETILAVGYSRSKGLVEFLPKKRLGGTISLFPSSHWKIAVEYLREFDYPVSFGGTGSVADIVTFQSAWEF